MRIEHIAIWVSDLEKMRSFYQKYFNMQCSTKYENPAKCFSSYFLSFETGTRIELMSKTEIRQGLDSKGMVLGLTHMAISVGSKESVNRLTYQLQLDGHIIASQPRTTGDGYYESVVMDPEGNQIEITE